MLPWSRREEDMVLGRPLVPTLVAMGLSVLLGGCASPISVGIPAYPSGGHLEADTRACEQDAAGGDEFGNRRVYMACMIAHGYRTYVPVATYWHMAEVTVAATRGQPQNQVLLDLEVCATDAGGIAGGRPLELAEAVDWVNVRLLRRGERVRDGSLLAPFAECLTKRGYTADAVKRTINAE
jgi:hypothetical protein